MKRYITLTIILFLLAGLSIFFKTVLAEPVPKKSDTIPLVKIQTLDQEPYDAHKIGQNGNPTLLVFWATCCVPCKKELNSISTNYKKWKNETGINVVPFR